MDSTQHHIDTKIDLSECNPKSGIKGGSGHRKWVKQAGAELGQAQPELGLGLNKFDLNNGNGEFGEGLNMSYGPTDKAG